MFHKIGHVICHSFSSSSACNHFFKYFQAWLYTTFMDEYFTNPRPRLVLCCMTSFIIHFHSHIVKLVLLYAYHESQPWSSLGISHNLFDWAWQEEFVKTNSENDAELVMVKNKMDSSRVFMERWQYRNYADVETTSWATPLSVFMMLLVTLETRVFMERWQCRCRKVWVSMREKINMSKEFINPS